MKTGKKPLAALAAASCSLGLSLLAPLPAFAGTSQPATPIHSNVCFDSEDGTSCVRVTGAFQGVTTPQGTAINVFRFRGTGTTYDASGKVVEQSLLLDHKTEVLRDGERFVLTSRFAFDSLFCVSQAHVVYANGAWRHQWESFTCEPVA
jgi:hypothetical protein